MKRFSALALVFALVISLAACTGGQSAPTAAQTTGGGLPAQQSTAQNAAETFEQVATSRLAADEYSFAVPDGWSSTNSNGVYSLTRGSDGAQLSVEAVGGELNAVAAEKVLLYNFYKGQYFSRGGKFDEGKAEFSGEQGLFYECYMSKELTRNTDIYWAYYFFAHGGAVFCVTVYSGSANLQGDAQIRGILNSFEF